MWWLSLALAAPGVPLAEGVLVDTSRGTVYLAAPGGGVDAVRASDGAVLWHSRAGDFPLASSGDLVVAWKDTSDRVIRVVGLDAARSGGTAVRCPDVPLPSWASPGIDAKLGGSSAVRARVRDGRIEAAWSAERHYAGGAAPTPEILASSGRSWEGSGRCGDGAWTDAAFREDPEVPPALEGKVPAGRRVGGAYVASYLDWKDRTGTIRLDRWDARSGERKASFELGTVTDGNTNPYLSQDGRQLAVVTQAPDGASFTSVPYDAATGEKGATIPVPLWTWVDTGGAYVTWDGQGLTAYHHDGTKAWSREVRSRAYQGPYPP